jgi:hypothetical protein
MINLDLKQEVNILNDVICRALDQLYENDNYLIQHALHEQCIAFRLGIYLQNELSNSCLSSYDLDAEYDHNINDRKRLPSWPDGARPDFIIHKRGENIGTNICVIELKKGEDKQVAERDKQKIIEFIECEDFRYKCGVAILLTQQRKNAILHWEVGK